MRFMMMVIPKGYDTSAADAAPGREAVAKMMEYNKNLQKAGVLLGFDGLLPPSTGARVSTTDGKATVTDGPFAEAKEAIGGFTIMEAADMDEALAWARKAVIACRTPVELREIPYSNLPNGTPHPSRQRKP
jgi:hypothetical protein